MLPISATLRSPLSGELVFGVPLLPPRVNLTPLTPRRCRTGACPIQRDGRSRLSGVAIELQKSRGNSRAEEEAVTALVTTGQPVLPRHARVAVEAPLCPVAQNFDGLVGGEERPERPR